MSATITVRHDLLRLAEQRLNERSADMVVDALLEGRDRVNVARNMLKEALWHQTEGMAVITMLRAELVEEAFPGRAVSEGT